MLNYTFRIVSDFVSDLSDCPRNIRCDGVVADVVVYVKVNVQLVHVCWFVCTNIKYEFVVSQHFSIQHKPRHEDTIITTRFAHERVT